MYVKITGRWFIDFVIKKEKTIVIYRLLAIYRNVFYSNLVTRESQKNVPVWSVQINNYSCTKRRKKQDSSLYRGCKLFLSKYQFEVVRVDCSIASIFSFRINILLFSKSIQFGIKTTRMEPNNNVELKEILKLLYLPPGQHLGSRKILKVFIICNNVNRIGQTPQIMLPNFKSFKNSK